MGSGLSTSRMALRLAGWIGAIKFFVEQFKNKMGGEKLGKATAWVSAVLELIGGISDNLIFFCRVSLSYETH